MNNFPSGEAVASVRKRFPAGCRVELVRMEDPFTTLKAGDRGTVQHVDDIGTIFVAWDNGSGLGIALGADVVNKL